MRFLVTGGAGFIGSHIVEALLRLGHGVSVVDNLSTGRTSNLVAARKADLIVADITDLRDMICATRGIDIVIHLAAQTSVPRSISSPIETNSTNVSGTLNILVAARDNRVRRVVYAASCAAYGDTMFTPTSEAVLPAPLSPYGVSKLAGEFYASVFSKLSEIEVVCIRYFNVFGPRQDPSSPYSGVLSRFISAQVSGERPIIYGDGEQSRDFVYVDNIVDLTLLAAETPGVSGALINGGSGTRHTLNEALRLLETISGKPIQPRYEAARPGDILHSQADISLARRIMGFEPRVGFEEGLRRTYQWFHSSSPDAKL